MLPFTLLNLTLSKLGKQIGDDFREGKVTLPVLLVYQQGTNDERHFLNALHDTVERGETAADELIRRYNTDWNGDVTRVFADYSY